MGSRKMMKSDPLFEALGSLDELNSWIGLCRVKCGNSAKLKVISEKLKDVQETLFIMQAEIAMYGMQKKSNIHLSIEKTIELEEEIRRIDEIVPQIKKFIISGGSEQSAMLDVARSLTRKVERAFVAFSKIKKINPEILRFINRLSSLLFAQSRFVNYTLKIKEENPSYK